MNNPSSSEPQSRTYYLQDSRGNTGENLMFWGKPEAPSYTTSLADARVFTEEEAFAQNHCRHTDIPWPTDYVDAHARRVVDTQYIKAAEAGPVDKYDAFYRQDPMRQYLGNDMMFLAKDGKSYTNFLDEAMVLSFEEAILKTIPGTGTAWPKAYIDSKSRPAADCRYVKLKDALKGVKRKLEPIPKVRKERYRCHGCGIFLSIGDYYSTCGCPRCNADNRP